MRLGQCIHIELTNLINLPANGLPRLCELYDKVEETLEFCITVEDNFDNFSVRLTMNGLQYKQYFSFVVRPLPHGLGRGPVPGLRISAWHSHRAGWPDLMISKCEMTSAEYSAQPPVGNKKPLSLHGELDPSSRVKIWIIIIWTLLVWILKYVQN